MKLTLVNPFWARFKVFKKVLGVCVVKSDAVNIVQYVYILYIPGLYLSFTHVEQMICWLWLQEFGQFKKPNLLGYK